MSSIIKTHFPHLTCDISVFHLNIMQKENIRNFPAYGKRFLWDQTLTVIALTQLVKIYLTKKK